MVPKILFLKNATSQLSNAVSTFFNRSCSPSKSECTSPENTQYFVHCWCILKNVIFRFKMTKKSQTLQHCTEILRHRIKICNTAFESPDIILFSPKKFGYHWGTHGTQDVTSLNQYENLTENVPTLPTNVILELNVVPQWYPKFYFWKIWCISFPTPCQPSS